MLVNKQQFYSLIFYNDNLNLQMTSITIDLLCNHKPHNCKCRHNTKTQISSSDLTSNLLKHNPALAKYLCKTSSSDVVADSNVVVGKGAFGKDQMTMTDFNGEYRSIVEEKGLRFLVDPREQNLPKKQPLLQQEEKQDYQKQQPIRVQSPKNLPTSPKNPPKKPQTANQKKLNQHYKDLKMQSRYLSNTGFRKYFSRQCFQNYGYKNTNHVADGIVYNNYLKTYNINPHSGQNLPTNQQTFYHALVSASPEKFKEVQRYVGKEKDQREMERSHIQRSKFDAGKLVKDNIKHNKIESKYEHLKLKSQNKNEQYTKSHENQKLNSPKQSLTIPHQISNQNPKYKFQSPNPTNLETQQYQNQPQIISSPKSYNINNNKCSHQKGIQNLQCDCCLSQMKQMLFTIADRDPELAERIISSAKKQIMYKNYSLNNIQNSKMNPKNYRNDGSLNVME